MKRSDRQQAIMDLLMAEREVEMEYLADRFSVSKMTIHRDLDELEGAGLLRKVRGGATMETGTRFESDFRFRELQGGAAKSTIAAAALDLVEPGMTVMINDGSMASVLGRMITTCRPLTVITNNVSIIDVLKAEAGITLIALGGVYSAKFNAFLGKVCEDSLKHLRADIAFISTPAVSGLEVFHMDEEVVRAKRAMMASSEQSCLLVNHLRFGHAALHKLADLNEFSSIITDHLPEQDSFDAMTAVGLPLTIAPPKEATT